MNKVVWSKALLYDFIENYKLHRCLWLKTHRKYYNKRQKSKAYIQLVNLIKDEFPNADVPFVKSKIKNIRCAFRKVYRKQQESQKNQESTTFEPKLWYFDLLLFVEKENKKSARTGDGQNDENMLEFENE